MHWSPVVSTPCSGSDVLPGTYPDGIPDSVSDLLVCEESYSEYIYQTTGDLSFEVLLFLTIFLIWDKIKITELLFINKSLKF